MEYRCPKCSNEVKKCHNDVYDMDVRYKCNSCEYESENELDFLINDVYNWQETDPDRYNNLKKLAEYAIAEVVSAGGDGDCYIICTDYNKKEIADIILKQLKEYDLNWEYKEEEVEHRIVISDNQEAIIIVDDINFEPPFYAQCVIKI